MKIFNYGKAIKEIKSYFDDSGDYNYSLGVERGLEEAIEIINNNISEKEEHIKIKDNKNAIAGILDGIPFSEPDPDEIVVNKIEPATYPGKTIREMAEIRKKIEKLPDGKFMKFEHSEIAKKINEIVDKING